MRPQTIPLHHDMTLLHLPGEEFRTGRLTGVFAVPLRESTAAGYAILPGLLTRCCRSLPTMPVFNRRLDELYGAVVEGQALALGQWQVLVFSINFLNKAYTLDGADLAGDATRLLLDLLFDPALENGAFREADFAQEQRCLLERLQAEINDKRLYARQRCKEVLCPDHPFSLNPYGTVDTVRALTPEAAAQAHKQLLSTARIHWLYQGDTDLTALTRTLERPFAALSERRAATMTADSAFTMKEDALTEEMDLRQAKLVLGFRIAATEPEGPVMAARLMNALWGGCPSSLLFRHVREEQSLCYYCASSYDRFQGVLLVDSGIEAADTERTQTEVLKQLEAIRQGDFSDEELEAARRSLIQRFASLEDTPADLEGWYVGQTLYDVYLTPEEAGNQLLAVTREDVCQAARLTHFDTAYLLRPTEEVCDQ